MATLTLTNSYPRRFTWTINDEVIRLRQWATDTCYDLPEVKTGRPTECTVGSGRSCRISLDDRWASRQHALLAFEQGRWSLSDVGSRNGVKVDGVRVTKVDLEPGAEIRIGRTTLLAESMKSIGLNLFFGRLLGWSKRQREAVDTAMVLARSAHRERLPLVLRGEGDLVPLAQELHARAFGPAAPFVVCDPYRRTVGASARAPANVDDGAKALLAAQGGALCIRNDKPPPSLRPLLKAALSAEPPMSVQIIVCDDGSRRLQVDEGKIIEIPSLATRSAPERLHVVTEYAADAARDLGAKRTLTGDDQAWVLRHCGSSFSEIGKGTRRLLAFRLEGSIAGAARRLSMTHAALRQWFAERAPAGFPAEDIAAVETKTEGAS